jgi:hypothetical protein
MTTTLPIIPNSPCSPPLHPPGALHDEAQGWELAGAVGQGGVTLRPLWQVGRHAAPVVLALKVA